MMPRIKHQCLATSLVLFSFIAWYIYTVYSDSGKCGRVENPVWVGLILAGIVGTILFDVFTLNPPDSHTYTTLRKQYCQLRLTTLARRASRQRLEGYTCNIMKYQEALLKEILARAEGTLYAMNLGQAKKVDDFRRIHPLADYTKIKPYVDRALLGEPSMLINDVVDYFAATTGTSSGKSKLFPLSKKLCGEIGSRGTACVVDLCKLLPGYNPLSRGLRIYITFEKLFTQTGVPIGPASQMYPPSVSGSVTPWAGLQISRMRTALYVQLLFGLSVPDIGWIMASFSSHLLSLFRLLEESWDQLCVDILVGHVSVSIELTSETRSALNSALKPNRKRAIELREEFNKGFKNIVTRIWPHCTSVFCITTGPFQPYTEILRLKYMCDIALFSPVHSATEGDYGINLTPSSRATHYTILPYSTFYEFIPFEDVEKKEPRTFLANEVEVGSMYEIVVTTFLGLYRYRTNDVIRITGHYNEAPMYEFVQRKGDNLDLLGEKTTAAIVQKTLQAAFTSWPHLELTDYTCTESVNIQRVTGEPSSLLYYAIFLEVENEARVTTENAAQLDRLLCLNQEEYDADRKAGRIKPLRIIQLKTGTFDSFKRLLVSSNRNASFAQLKIPRVIRREEHIRFMLEPLT